MKAHEFLRELVRELEARPGLASGNMEDGAAIVVASCLPVLAEEAGRIADALGAYVAFNTTGYQKLEELEELAELIIIKRTQEGSFVSAQSAENLSRAADLIDSILDRDSRGEPL